MQCAVKPSSHLAWSLSEVDPLSHNHISYRVHVTGCNSSLTEKLATLSMVSMRHSHGWIHSLSLPFLTFVTAEQIQGCALSEISIDITKNLLLTRFFFFLCLLLAIFNLFWATEKAEEIFFLFPHSHSYNMFTARAEGTTQAKGGCVTNVRTCML